MNYFFDAKTNAFYPVELKDSYLAKGVWPENGVEVDEAVFAAFQNPPEGKMRIADNEGYPSWADTPPPTHEEQMAAAEAEKQSLLNHANEYINSKQWPGKAAIGRLKGGDLTQYNLWLDYLDALEAVDTSGAPNIKWPTSPVS